MQPKNQPTNPDLQQSEAAGLGSTIPLGVPQLQVTPHCSCTEVNVPCGYTLQASAANYKTAGVRGWAEGGKCPCDTVSAL